MKRPFDPWTATFEGATQADENRVPIGDSGVFHCEVDPKTGKQPNGPFSQYVAAKLILSERGSVEGGGWLLPYGRSE